MRSALDRLNRQKTCQRSRHPEHGIAPAINAPSLPKFSPRSISATPQFRGKGGRGGGGRVYSINTGPIGNEAAGSPRRANWCTSPVLASQNARGEGTLAQKLSGENTRLYSQTATRRRHRSSRIGREREAVTLPTSQLCRKEAHPSPGRWPAAKTAFAPRDSLGNPSNGIPKCSTRDIPRAR